MNVRGLILMDDFSRSHRDAEAPLQRWLAIVEKASWTSFVECRRTFPHADQVRVHSSLVTVFNIKGNNYRLAVVVNYIGNLVVIRRIMTHKEYSQDRWKDFL